MEMILFVLGQQVVMFLSLLYLGYICKRCGMSLREYFEDEEDIAMITRIMYILSLIPIIGVLVSVVYFFINVYLGFIIMSDYDYGRKNPSSIVRLIDKLLKNI